MDFFHFRLHTDELQMADLVSFLHEQASVNFIVKEFGKGNREHIHACLSLKVPRQTFTDRLKRKFTVVKGNGYYSLQKLKKDYDTNARYCYKGTASDYPDIVYTIHTEEEWKKYYNDYWSQFKKNKVEHVDTTTYILPEKKVKVKALPWSKKLTNRLFEDYPMLCKAIIDYHASNCGSDIEYDKLQQSLLSICLRALGNESKNLDEFILIRLYNGQLNAILSRYDHVFIDKAQENYDRERYMSIRDRLN